MSSYYLDENMKKPLTQNRVGGIFFRSDINLSISSISSRVACLRRKDLVVLRLRKYLACSRFFSCHFLFASVCLLFSSKGTRLLYLLKPNKPND